MTAVVSGAALPAHVHIELDELHLSFIRRELHLFTVFDVSYEEHIDRIVDSYPVIDSLVQPCHFELCSIRAASEGLIYEVLQFCMRLAAYEAASLIQLLDFLLRRDVERCITLHLQEVPVVIILFVSVKDKLPVPLSEPLVEDRCGCKQLLHLIHLSVRISQRKQVLKNIPCHDSVQVIAGLNTLVHPVALAPFQSQLI